MKLQRSINIMLVMAYSLLFACYVYLISLCGFWPGNPFSYLILAIFVGFVAITAKASFLLIYHHWPDFKLCLPRVHGRWRRSREEWHPVAESDQCTFLCERCRNWTSKSKLIMGSKNYFTRTEERHKFYPSLTEFGRRVNLGSQPCHLCCQLWYSIDPTLRQKIQESPSQYSSLDLKILVREELPFSKWSFAELIESTMVGTVVIGARLLIQREENNEIAIPATSSLATSTDSSHHTQQAKEWLERCISLHDCHESSVVKDKPTRLVQITSTGSSIQDLRLKIQEYGASSTVPAYLTFSHCWGGSSKSLRYLKSNQHSFGNDIPFSQLSKNIQDSIIITKQLGFSYIWIDSLCILQDSVQDWSQESMKMASIYAGAVCTIASSGSSSGEGGCFHQREPLSLQPCKIGVRSNGGEFAGAIYIRQDDLLDFQRGVENAPLNKRGWVFQERWLSRRILHFGANGLYWECSRRCASELNPNGYVYRRFPEDFVEQDNQYIPEKGENVSREVIKRGQIDRSTPVSDPYELNHPRAAWQRGRNAWKEIRRASEQDWEHDKGNADGCGIRAHFNMLRRNKHTNEGLGHFTHCWYEIVEPYSHGKLTFPSDKLVALSAIVQQIQHSTGYTFLAGLWKEHLVTDLLWFVLEKPGLRLNTTESYANSTVEKNVHLTSNVAPTWSWASLEGAVGVDLNPKTFESKIHFQTVLAELVEAQVGAELPKPNDYQPDKPVMKDFIKLKGPLLTAYKAKGLKTTHWLSLDDDAPPTIRFIPDVIRNEKYRNLVLFCFPILVMQHQTISEKKKEIQGLVLTPSEKGDGSVPRPFERVGFFTTYQMNMAKASNKRLVDADVVTICIV